MDQLATGIVFWFFASGGCGYRSTSWFAINALRFRILILIKNNNIIPMFTLFPSFLLGL